MKVDEMEYPVYFKNIETLIYNVGECALNHQVFNQEITDQDINLI